MLSTEFDLYFKNVKNFYLGCFSADNYPQNLKTFQFFVVNKDKSFEKGSHWMVVFLGDKNIEFFDSCGSNESFVKHFLKFNKQFVCVFNDTPVQESNTNTCGEYCIYFAISRLSNIDQSFGKVMNICFSHELEKNNQKVLQFCRNLFQKNVELS